MKKNIGKKINTINNLLNFKKLNKIGKISLIITVILSSSNPLSSSAKSLSAEDNLAIREIENTVKKIDGLLLEEVGTDVESKENFVNNVNNVHEVIDENVGRITSAELFGTPIFKKLSKKLGKLDIKADPYINGEIGVNATSWRYGDILYYPAFATNGNGEKSLTGHTAVLSTTSNYVIEAAKTLNGNKVLHWSVSKLWADASEVQQYKVTSKLGTNATTTERTDAVNYGLAQVGEPYNLYTTIWSTDEWYCSKLTNAQWDSVGYNLQSSNAYTLNGIVIIKPIDITLDLNTRLVKEWGTTLPTSI